MLTAMVGEQTLKVRLPSQVHLPQPGESVWLQVLGAHTCFYKDEELVA
jgi:glycerol transport system ATP-binding protein